MTVCLCPSEIHVEIPTPHVMVPGDPHAGRLVGRCGPARARGGGLLGQERPRQPTQPSRLNSRLSSATDAGGGVHFALSP